LPFLLKTTRYFFLKKRSYLTYLLKYESQFYNRVQATIILPDKLEQYLGSL